MKQRIITAILSLIVFVPIVYMGSVILTTALAILSLIALFELFRMKGHSLLSVEGLIASIALLLILIPSKQGILGTLYSANMLFYICVLLLLVSTVFSKNKFNFDDAAMAILGSIYIGFGFKYFLLIRFEGLGLLLLALFIVWATDIGAYLVGRKFGKNKLAPHISPNKTIEGSLGGVFSALVVATIYFFVFPLDFSFGMTVILAILISVSGQLGDLVESALKRHYQVKDSGKILPGHGGILDRFDSILFAMPVLYLLTLV
ncbi:phosphatidate cytidylyltransferase [Carnobacterium funditum]|uniref:phosphatidate cytidylyltransferase n=1 Tax=Carnobacterium funditum TaxID=2752 RepID=UPI00054D7FA8|nr:phosphatidate cytidylyltransferase [Carnobacterium funditum]